MRRPAALALLAFAGAFAGMVLAVGIGLTALRGRGHGAIGRRDGARLLLAAPLAAAAGAYIALKARA